MSSKFSSNLPVKLTQSRAPSRTNVFLLLSKEMWLKSTTLVYLVSLGYKIEI